MQCALLRLSERLPGDAFMGVQQAGASYRLYSPGLVDKTVPRDKTSASKWLFFVLVRVEGEKLIAETISVTGHVWDRFELH